MNLLNLLNSKILFQQLPKVELHLHLDCSLSFEVVKQLLPETTEADYQKDFVGPAKCNDLNDYINKAIKSIEIMQTAEQLRLVTMDLFRQLKADNVIYAEIRFAPLQHLQNGLSPIEVVATVNNACEAGIKAYGIEAGIILCTLRHYSETQSMQTVELVEAFKGTRVVGFDIAADEAGFPIDNHIKAFEFAQSHHIRCTAHAGEAKGPESVWETLQHFHPERIGHGVRSAEDPQLLKHLKAHQIHLEVCPSSNIKINIFDTIASHTANMIYESGVSMSINTDGRGIANVTLTDEYNLMNKAFNWNIEQLKKCNLEAVAHAFTSEVIKAKLKQQIEDAYVF